MVGLRAPSGRAFQDRFQPLGDDRIPGKNGSTSVAPPPALVHTVLIASQALSHLVK